MPAMEGPLESRNQKEHLCFFLVPLSAAGYRYRGYLQTSRFFIMD
jgi:hypothetical protein